MRERKKERKKERKEHTPESVIMERTGFPRKDLVIEFSALDIAIGFLLVPFFFVCVSSGFLFFCCRIGTAPKLGDEKTENIGKKKERKKEKQMTKKTTIIVSVYKCLSFLYLLSVYLLAVVWVVLL